MLSVRKMPKNNVLILEDLQNDFLPGGALGVKDSEVIVEVANRVMPHFHRVIATQDWHPATHCSFSSNHYGYNNGDVIIVNGQEQDLWPDHCIQNTYGAELARGLNTIYISEIFHKGYDPYLDSYSDFYDNGHFRETGFETHLREMGIDTIYIMGLTTEYCVKYSALDACVLGFNTKLIIEGVKAFNMRTSDGQDAIEEMERAGVEIISEKDIISECCPA